MEVENRPLPLKEELENRLPIEVVLHWHSIRENRLENFNKKQTGRYSDSNIPHVAKTKRSESKKRKSVVFFCILVLKAKRRLKPSVNVQVISHHLFSTAQASDVLRIQSRVSCSLVVYQTTEERLKDYFSMFGEVREAKIKKDRITGRARGFGFLVFADPDMVLLQSMHTIDGQMGAYFYHAHHRMQRYASLYGFLIVEVMKGEK